MAFPQCSHRSLFLPLFLLFLTCPIGFAQSNLQQQAQSAATSTSSGSLSCSSCNLWFGSVAVGHTETKSDKITNTGSTRVYLSRVYLTGIGFSLSNLVLPMTLDPGQSVQFSVSFRPPAIGHVDGNFEVINTTSNGPLYFAVHGTGVSTSVLGANPSSINFGTVQAGKSATLPETLTNSGRASVTVSQVNAAGTGFRVTGLSLPLTLTPGQSFTFGAVFSPTRSGSATGSISVVSTASNASLTISLSGAEAASGQLIESPTSLNFNNVTVGTSESLPLSLSATGSSVTISSATTNNSEFKLSGLTLPFTLAAGQSVSFKLNFTPQSSGAASGSISFVSNASNSPTAESVTGSGVSTSGHAVNLTWGASSSPVTGYNIYRGSISGGPYIQINSTLDSSTTYTDVAVVAGQTYYYVSTALNAKGIESGFSNQVKAVIPSP